MVKAGEFLSTLHSFAESFTGFPVRIIIPSQQRSIDELVQTQGAMKIYVPSEIKTNFLDNDEKTEYNIYKGLVSLQASAALYDGIPIQNEDGNDIFKERLFIVENLEELVDQIYRGGLIGNCYNVFEVSRRMQCISKDYSILFEDMISGFPKLFDPRFLKSSEIIEKDRNQNEYLLGVNEFDLALTYNYWKSLGVETGYLDRIVSTIPKDKDLGVFREELIKTFQFLSIYSSPLNTSYLDSIERLSKFVLYINGLSKDLGMTSPLKVDSVDELYQRSINRSKRGFNEEGSETFLRDTYLRLLKTRLKNLEEMLEKIDSGKEVQLEQGIYDKERILQRIETVKKSLSDAINTNFVGNREFLLDQETKSMLYSRSSAILVSQRKIFSEVPLEQIAKLDIPETLIEESGRVVYLPELRNRAVEKKAVRAVVYDLLKDQPLSQEQSLREREFNLTLNELQSEINEHNKKIRSDTCYIYDNLPEIVKKRDSLDRRLKQEKKRYNESMKIHKESSTKPVEYNTSSSIRVVRTMENIRPANRSIVRNCFEGELDWKKYFDYILRVELGEDPSDNFFYRWEKRKRDVSSVLLIDASHSANRLVSENKTLLDHEKEAAYYYAIAAETLEDKCAVIAYNGKGPSDLRLFLLKDFLDPPSRLLQRLELLNAELNNRDGPAIRYAADFLGKVPSKSKFLFQIGDMSPSDIEFEIETDAVLTYPYRGEEAINDVTNSFNYARSLGIIPTGICIKKAIEQKTEKKPAIKGKINPVLLKKIQAKKEKESVGDIDHILKRNFGRNYVTLTDPKDLYLALNKVYIQTSFH